MNLTIATSGTDPLETLQITATIPTTETVYQGSLSDLKNRIDSYAPQRQALQDAEAADQALYDSIVSLARAAGVADISAPMTPTLNAAVETKSAEANALLE